MTARLLFVDASSKRLGLSTLPHLLNARLPAAVPQLGQLFEGAQVARVERGLGLLLRLPLVEPGGGAAAAGGGDNTSGQQQQASRKGGKKKKQDAQGAQQQDEQQQDLGQGSIIVPAFAHISNLSDDAAGKKDDTTAKFAPGDRVAARVIGFRLVDGLAAVSLKPSVLAQQV
jgi:hypothetical protein